MHFSLPQNNESACGKSGPVTADIKQVTCRDCIREHDEFQRGYDKWDATLAHEAAGDLAAEECLRQTGDL